MEVTPSCSIGHTSDTLAPVVGFQSAASLLKCAATSKSSTSISKSRISTSESSTSIRKSNIMDEIFDNQSRSRSTSPLNVENKMFNCDKTDMRVITSSPITIASSSVMETSTYTLSGFQPSSLLMYSTKDSHPSSSSQTSTTEAGTTRTKTNKLSGCKPSSSLVHSSKGKCSSAIRTSSDKLSGFRPASSLVSLKEIHSLPSDQKMLEHSSRQHGTIRDSPITSSHDHHMTSINGKCNKQKVASLVVSVLNPYLKKGKITDKVKCTEKGHTNYVIPF